LLCDPEQHSPTIWGLSEHRETGHDGVCQHNAPVDRMEEMKREGAVLQQTRRLHTLCSDTVRCV
jgi:hypothetical protein